MPRIEIYTTRTCSYCVRAKSLLRAKGLAYEEIDLTRDPSRIPEMIERASGLATVPQIFING